MYLFIKLHARSLFEVVHCVGSLTLKCDSCHRVFSQNQNICLEWTYFLISIIRVATAQGKQGIWLLTFPDRENTGNLVNLIFYTGKIVATQGKF